VICAPIPQEITTAVETRHGGIVIARYATNTLNVPTYNYLNQHCHSFLEKNTPNKTTSSMEAPNQSINRTVEELSRSNHSHHIRILILIPTNPSDFKKLTKPNHPSIIKKGKSLCKAAS